MYVPNPLFEQEFAAEPSVIAHLYAIAEGVAVIAKGFDPEGDEGWITATTRGADVYVSNPNPIGHILEFGSVNSPPYSPIRRGVLAAGLQLREIPKP